MRQKCKLQQFVKSKSEAKPRYEAPYCRTPHRSPSPAEKQQLCTVKTLRIMHIMKVDQRKGPIKKCMEGFAVYMSSYVFLKLLH